MAILIWSTLWFEGLLCQNNPYRSANIQRPEVALRQLWKNIPQMFVELPTLILKGKWWALPVNFAINKVTPVTVIMGLAYCKMTHTSFSAHKLLHNSWRRLFDKLIKHIPRITNTIFFNDYNFYIVFLFNIENVESNLQTMYLL